MGVCADGDGLRGFLVGVAGEKGIARGRFHTAVSEKPADGRQALAERQRPRRIGVDRIVAGLDRRREHPVEGRFGVPKTRVDHDDDLTLLTGSEISPFARRRSIVHQFKDFHLRAPPHRMALNNPQTEEGEHGLVDRVVHLTWRYESWKKSPARGKFLEQVAAALGHLTSEWGIGRMRGRVVHMLECHLYYSLAAWGRDYRSGSLALCGQEVSGLLSTEDENEVTCKTCRARLESYSRYTERVEANREFRHKEHELRKAQIKERRKRTTALNKTRKVPLKVHYGDPSNRSTIVCGMVTGGKGTYDLEKVTCRRCRTIAEELQERDANWRDEWVY